METIRLLVQERREIGDGPARRLRAQGLIPGVTYGKGKPATPISVGLGELRAALAHGQNAVLELDFGQSSGRGKKEQKGNSPRYAVIKEVQVHPIKRQVLHVDLHEVDLAVEIEATVAVEPVGTPVGAADGGIMEWERREVLARALPASMPAVFELDVSGLHIGQHLTVAALSVPHDVTIVDDTEAVVVALVAPRVERAPEEEELAEEAAEAPETPSDSMAGEEE